jgi:hypothetical protein
MEREFISIFKTVLEFSDNTTVLMIHLRIICNLFVILKMEG